MYMYIIITSSAYMYSRVSLEAKYASGGYSATP
jgi:hypothetical protein